MQSEAERLAAEFSRRVLAGEIRFDRALVDLISALQGARGAVVLILGLTAEGTLTAAPMPPAAERGVRKLRSYRVMVRDFERSIFRQALRVSRGNAPNAARLLQLSQSTFRYQAIKLGVLTPKRRGSSPR